MQDYHIVCRGAHVFITYAAAFYVYVRVAALPAQCTTTACSSTCSSVALDRVAVGSLLSTAESFTLEECFFFSLFLVHTHNILYYL